MIEKQKAFTLIELSIVCFIIALLATIIAVGTGNHLRTSRDAQRKSDLNTILMAFEMYYERNGTYNLSVKNPSAGSNGQGAINTSYSGGPSLGSVLVNLGLLSTPPRDPLLSKNWNDYYVRFSKPGEKSGICLYALVELTSNINTELISSDACYPEVKYNYVIGHK